MSIRELSSVLGRESRDWLVDWKIVESRLGISLPSDYKMLVEGFGPGCFGGFFWHFVPEYPNPWIDLESGIAEFGATFSALREQFSTFSGIRIFPEEGGLLPWGRTDNGNYLLWRCVGDPDAWASVIYEERGPRFEGFELPASELILGFLTGRIRSSILPDDLEGNVTFDPLT